MFLAELVGEGVYDALRPDQQARADMPTEDEPADVEVVGDDLEEIDDPEFDDVTDPAGAPAGLCITDDPPTADATPEGSLQATGGTEQGSAEPPRKIEHRFLWRGWADKARDVVAACILTSREGEIIPFSTRTDHGFRLEARQLSSGSMDVSFLVYRVSKNTCYYLNRAHGLGARTFFLAIAPRYNERRRTHRDEAVDAVRGPYKVQVRDEYNQQLKCELKVRQAKLKERLLELQKGEIIFTAATKAVAVQEGVRTNLQGVQLRLRIEGEAPMSDAGANLFTRLARKYGNKGRVVGTDLAGKRINFDLEKLQEAAAIEELDDDEWPRLTYDLELDEVLFPLSRETGTLILPFELLMRVMAADEE